MATVAATIERAPARAQACPACGGLELEIDQVGEREALLLAECRRCGQRWTARLAAPPEAPATHLVRARSRRAREVPSAA